VGFLDSKKIPVVNFDRDPFFHTAKEISLVLSISLKKCSLDANRLKHDQEPASSCKYQNYGLN